MATSQQPPASSGASAAKRFDNMALIFQEVLTVVVRLRANRQKFGDPEVFRSQIRNALKTAQGEGTRRGYSGEDMGWGTFAVVVFLDESILNSQNPVFADWQRKPLQEELFQEHVGGVTFFEYLQKLSGRPDSEALADLLEVYQLCLLLGFRGRFSASGTTGEIRSIIAQIEEKIRRIRGAVPGLEWQPSVQMLPAAGDKWSALLKWGAMGCVLLSILLFVFYKVSLSSAAGDLTTLAAGAGK